MKTSDNSLAASHYFGKQQRFLAEHTNDLKMQSNEKIVLTWNFSRVLAQDTVNQDFLKNLNFLFWRTIETHAVRIITKRSCVFLYPHLHTLYGNILQNYSTILQPGVITRYNNQVIDIYAVKYRSVPLTQGSFELPFYSHSPSLPYLTSGNYESVRFLQFVIPRMELYSM